MTDETPHGAGAEPAGPEPTGPEPTGFRADQLDGFRIGVTSDRRSEDLIDAFRRRGAEVVHAPTLKMANSAHDDVVIDDTRAIIREQPDVLLATTSYGIRRWFEVADTAGIGDELLEALQQTAVLVRGPKARGGIRAAGLNDRGMSDRETTESLVTKTLAEFSDAGTVAIQLHGFTDKQQLDRLRDAGHPVLTVAPYRWLTPDAKDNRVERLIDTVIAGQLDVLTFTSAPGADALLNAAEGLGKSAELIAAMQASTILIVAVGPVTAAPLLEAGIPVIHPERYRLGALIRLVCEQLEQNAVLRVDTKGGQVVLRGSVLRVESDRVVLPPTSLALFRTLAAAAGGVVSRSDLSRSTPTNLDDHALEVALSRLRRAMPSPSLIQTVIKRGYRLNV